MIYPPPYSSKTEGVFRFADWGQSFLPFCGWVKKILHNFVQKWDRLCYCDTYSLWNRQGREGKGQDSWSPDSLSFLFSIYFVPQRTQHKLTQKLELTNLFDWKLEYSFLESFKWEQKWCAVIGRDLAETSQWELCAAGGEVPELGK